MPPKNNKWLGAYREWRETEHGQEVYNRAYMLAIKMVARGFKHYSMQLIVCVIRHEIHLETGRDDKGYKVNNNYASYLAREIGANQFFPPNFFTTRD